MASFLQERSPGCFSRRDTSADGLVKEEGGWTYGVHLDSHRAARLDGTLCAHAPRPADVAPDVGARDVGDGGV